MASLGFVQGTPSPQRSMAWTTSLNPHSRQTTLTPPVQVEAALRMHTSDNVSVVMVCFGPDAPPRRSVCRCPLRLGTDV